METWRRRESGSLISGLLCLLIVEGHDPREWNRSFNNVAKCTRERKCETEYRDKGYGHVITRTSICEIDSMIIESLHLQIRRLIVSSSFVYIRFFFSSRRNLMLDEWYLSLPLVSKFIEADLSDVDRTGTSRVFRNWDTRRK